MKNMSFLDQVRAKKNKSPRAEFIEEIALAIGCSSKHVYRCIKAKTFQPYQKKLIALHLGEDEQILFPN